MHPPGPAIVASRSDPASLNIAQNLIQHHRFNQREETHGTQIYESGNVTLVIVEKECVHLQPEEIPIKSTSIIFASKHRSNTETPALTVHATGNLTREAIYGGNPE